VVRRRPTIFLLVATGALLADTLAQLGKVATDRERPPVTIAEPEALVELPGSSSFPSGHSATSFACATLLAYLMPRFAIPLYVLAALIAFSRSYVGVHYPLDVLAGAALGFVTAVSLLVVLGYGRRRAG
jgi:undecaprenyl-diphosphatase